MRVTGAAALALLLVSAAATSARAALYSFVDDEGVVHFTNLPDEDPRYQPVPLDGAANTFKWQDDLGALRKVHRVDVADYDELIVEAARYYSLPPALIKAMIAVESSFEATAISPAGAIGLMQLVPETALEVFVSDPFDPRDNVFGGVRYLRILTNRFSGDLRRTIAAYNAGPTAVERAGDVPPIAETRRYVQRVLALYKHYLANWLTELP
jgi:soluble lytic murein transglycosylase-like protein